MAARNVSDFVGRAKGPRKAEFPKGSTVKIAGRAILKEFLLTWKYHHNKLKPEQLQCADNVATVKSAGFYHGGDELYKLVGVPGLWHEQCLTAVK